MQTRITIRGRSYTVRGDESEEEVRATAAELEARLAEVEGRTRAFDEYTIALLTALNLVSEVRRLRREARERLAEVDRELGGIVAILEAALPPEPGADAG